MVAAAPQAEFDRPLRLDRITTEETGYRDVASDDERVAVARRLDIPVVDALGYDLTVSLAHKETTVAIRGLVTATVTLECSISLERFAMELSEDVRLDLTLPGSVDRGRAAVPHEELELDEAEILFPEVLEGSVINLGEVAVEALSLALPKYPRAPNAALPDGVTAEDAAETLAQENDSHRPFAKLAVLKDYQKKSSDSGA